MNNLPSATLVEKRCQWLNALTGNDRHAIIKQLTQMSWDSAAFRVVNEARRLAPSDPDGGVKLNSMVHSLVNRGFFAGQIIAIRRLMDTYSLKGKRGVFSLVGLLKDMMQYRHLLTRQGIFAAEELVYDYEPIKQKFFEYAETRRQAGKKASYIPKDVAWRIHERRHQVIDVLAGTTPQKRHPEDEVQEVVFKTLLNKAKGPCKDIIAHANKFIAHAASPDSRAIEKADDIAITLGHLWKAHEQLCQTTGFLAIIVLGASCPPFLPIPQYDQFQYIERPLIKRNQVDRLAAIWRDFEKKLPQVQPMGFR